MGEVGNEVQKGHSWSLLLLSHTEYLYTVMVPFAATYMASFNLYNSCMGGDSSCHYWFIDWVQRGTEGSS